MVLTSSTSLKWAETSVSLPVVHLPSAPADRIIALFAHYLVAGTQRSCCALLPGRPSGVAAGSIPAAQISAGSVTTGPA